MRQFLLRCEVFLVFSYRLRLSNGFSHCVLCLRIFVKMMFAIFHTHIVLNRNAGNKKSVCVFAEIAFVFVAGMGRREVFTYYYSISSIN